MHPDLVLLVALDQADEALTRAERALTAARNRPGEARVALAAAEAALVAAQGEVDAAKAEERAQQRKLSEYENRRAGAVRALETGQGSAEAAERQLAQVREIMGDTETAILEAMERHEVLCPQRDTRRAERDAAAAALRAVEAAAPPEIAALEAEVAQAQASREAARAPIAKDLAVAYDRLRARKSRAVTPIRKDTCNACNTVISAQRLANAARGVELLTCSNCARFLVPPAAPSA